MVKELSLALYDNDKLKKVEAILPFNISKKKRALSTLLVYSCYSLLGYIKTFINCPKCYKTAFTYQRLFN